MVNDDVGVVMKVNDDVGIVMIRIMRSLMMMVVVIRNNYKCLWKTLDSW